MGTQKNPKLHDFAIKWLGSLYTKHFARISLYLALGIYLAHQFDKEVVNASTNYAFHFYWDILGLVANYAFLSPFFRKKIYISLHEKKLETQ
jgi:hypothetical protein